MTKFNLITATDSYKNSHWLQYPPDTEAMFSYIESRGGKFKETVMFGLRYIIQNYISKPITQENINRAEKIAKFQGVPFNKKGWEYILEKHNGYIPVRIKAIPEGKIVKTGNALVTIESTDPNVFWVVGHIEPLLLRLWYPVTVATLVKNVKNIIKPFVEKTSDNVDSIEFMFTDFGARAATSHESASIAGMAHLINFSVTDTIEAIEQIIETYDTDDFIAGSVPASEHSTITSWGQENEEQAYENMINKFCLKNSKYKSPIMACVLDAYDIFNAVDNYIGKSLKQKIIESDTLFVCRPDCYSDDTEILTENGWKFFKDVTMNDKVASVDEKQNIIFTTPNKVMNYDYKGIMYHFTGKHNIDIMVTPNHKMVLFCAEKKIPILNYEFAENTVLNHRKFLTAGYTNITGDKLSPYERLLIAFQADGSYSSKKDSLTGLPKNKNSIGLKIVNHEQIRFNFAKQRKIDRIAKIAEDCGFEYKIADEPARKGQKTIYINVPLCYKLFKTLNWVKPETRSKEWLSDFLDELSNWDATIRNNKRFCYTTTFEENVEPILTACVLSGRNYTYRIYKDNRKEHFSDVHTISIRLVNFINSKAIKVNKINYDGKVYCVNVDTGMLMVRRNKKPIICGNSGVPLYMVMTMIDKLDKVFGHTVNSKGYKVLNHVRVIQGDGINDEEIFEILNYMEMSGYSTDNIVFGAGGFIHQNGLTRDTQKFALKCSSVKRNGIWQDVFKSPITDKGKMSKKGVLDVYFDGEKHITLTKGISAESIGQKSSLVIYYENGKTFFDKKDTFQNVKNRLEGVIK